MSDRLVFNPDTQKAMRLQDNKWVDTPVVVNPQNGEVRAWDGQSYSTVVKGDTANAGGEAVRKAEMFARGATDTAFDYLTALPRLAERGLDALGLPKTGIRLDPREAYKQFGSAISKPVQNILELGGADLGPAGLTKGDQVAARAGGGVVDAAAFMLPAATLAKAAKTGTTTQRVASQLAAQPVVQGSAGAVAGGTAEATDSELLGLAAGLATPSGIKGVQKLISPSPPNRSSQRMIDLAKKENIPLTPAQMTDNKSLGYFESLLEGIPSTGGRQAKAIDQTSSAFNTAILRKAGIKASDASDDVMRKAGDDFGKEFDQLEKVTTLRADQEYVDGLQRISREYLDYLPSQRKGNFEKLVNDAMAIASPAEGVTMRVKGETYQKFVSKLRKLSRGAKSDPDYKAAIDDLIDHIDETAFRSADTQALKNAWKNLRNRYRTYKIIEDAMSSANASDGNIAPTAFYNAVKRAQGKSRMVSGQGPLEELARLGTSKIRPSLPNSGTAQRNMMARFIGGPGAQGAVGAGGGMALGFDPITSAAVSLGLPRMVQEMYLSPIGRRYLANQAVTNKATMNPALATAITAAQGRDVPEELRGLLGVTE